MQVEIRKQNLKKRFMHAGKERVVEQPFGLDMVLADGVQVGWVPNNEKDPNYDCLHPLSTSLPPQFFQEVVRASKGRLKRTLKGPKPQAETVEEPSK